MKIISLNAQSLTAEKLFEIHSYIKEQDVDIIAIQETWYKDFRSCVDIPGYNVMRNDRTTSKQGGTAMYYKSNLKLSADAVLSITSNTVQYEQQAIKVHLSEGKHLYILNCYCPRTNLYEEAMSALYSTLEKLTLRRANYLILGDLNINSLQQSQARDSLYELCAHFDLASHVNEATRITATSQTNIDYALSSPALLENVLNCDLIIPCNSDHLGIEITLKASTPEKETTTKSMRIYKHFNPELFCEEILQCDWTEFTTAINNKDVQSATELLKNTLVTALDHHAPRKLIQLHSNYAPWVTPKLRTQLKKRNHLRYAAMKTKDTKDWHKYHHERNLVNYQLRKARHDYNKEQFEIKKTDKRKQWRMIKSLITNKSQLNCKASTRGELDEMNQYFVSVGSKIPASSHQPSVTPTVTNLSSFSPASHIDVIKAVGRLPSWGAPGIDDINGHVLKSALPAIYRQLTELINLSLDIATFPTIFKKAVVIPIQKLPGITEPDKHRPISLLTLLSKVLERIVYAQIYQHVEPLLSDSQHGFRRNRSTSTALLTITDQILQSMDNHCISLLILLDLSKAFDSVNHDLLIAKLRTLGLDQHIITWIKSYLSERTQVVRANKVESAELAITTGVPQGSILGPLLFLIYTNDLPDSVTHANVVQFADDTQLLYHYNPKSRSEPSNIAMKIQGDLQQIASWCQSNCLQLNSKKTQFLPIAEARILQRTLLPTVSLNGNVLVPCSTARNLGVEFDDKLSFKSHIANVIRTANGRISNLGRLVNDVPPDVLKMVAEATIINPALYCLPVWSSCYQTDLSKLQRRILHWPAKIITNRRKYDRMGNLLVELDWMSLSQQATYQTAMMSHQACNGQTNTYLSELFDKAEHTHNTRTATSTIFNVPSQKTDRGKRRFGCLGPTTLNRFHHLCPLDKFRFRNKLKLEIKSN